MTEKEITEYLFLEDADQRGDIAFVFGNWKAYKESVAKAVELYKNGLVSKIIFTGGINKHSGVIEGDLMAEEAMNLGVPQRDILIENKASNTLENVLFSIPIIEEYIGFKNITAITAIAKNAHIRRGLMTLKKHFPSAVVLRAAPYQSKQYYFTKENWMNDPYAKEVVAEELKKIETYLAKGDLAEL